MPSCGGAHASNLGRRADLDTTVRIGDDQTSSPTDTKKSRDEKGLGEEDTQRERELDTEREYERETEERCEEHETAETADELADDE